MDSTKALFIKALCQGRLGLPVPLTVTILCPILKKVALLLMDLFQDCVQLSLRGETSAVETSITIL